MRYRAAESGVVRNEIERIFERVGKIIDEYQKKHRAQNTALRNSSLNRKGRLEKSIQGHMLTATGKEVHKPGVEISMDTIGGESGEQSGVPDVLKACDMSRETALISCLALRTSIHC